MSLPVPLSVVLKTGRITSRITSQVHDLVFRDVVPGGYAAARAPLSRPLTVQPDDIAYYGRLIVVDNRNGQTVWEGRLEDPARSSGSDGEVWELAAVGPAAHTLDVTVPLVYVDRDLSSLVRVENITPGANDSLGEIPNGTGDQGLVLQFPAALPLVVGSLVAKQYRRIWQAGQKLARYDYAWDAGLTSSTQQVQAVTRTNTTTSLGAGEASRSENFTTAGAGSSPRVVVTNFGDGRNSVELRIIRSSAPGTVTLDDNWAGIKDFAVLAMRYNADGTEKTTGYSTNTVLASEVVADLLGRLLPQYDGASATVAVTAHPIDQLAYPDGVQARQVLDDLMLLEPAFYWAAWERSAGKHRFEWRAWPTTVRYEADIKDGYVSTGSADGLYNAVRVRWLTPAGEVRSNRRTQTVAELDGAGLDREAFLDLDGEVGSSDNADRAGDEFLADYLSAKNAGKLTIARPIRDNYTGRLVMPWEIRPGNLIRIRGVLPRIDALNATTRDGVTVFRIVAKEFSASSALATLDLDTHPPSVARALADLQHRFSQHRRTGTR